MLISKAFIKHYWPWVARIAQRRGGHDQPRNAELANGRLALLSGSAGPRVKAVRRAAEIEERGRSPLSAMVSSCVFLYDLFEECSIVCVIAASYSSDRMGKQLLLLPATGAGSKEPSLERKKFDLKLGVNHCDRSTMMEDSWFLRLNICYHRDFYVLISNVYQNDI